MSRISWLSKSLKKMRSATLDDFAGKVAVITGAGSGIGAALAREAARIWHEGDRVELG